MNATERLALECELEMFDRVVKASEDWSKEYAKDPATHEELIKNEARFERKLRKFFKDQSEKASTFVDWSKYVPAIQAYNVNTMIVESVLGDMNDTFLTIAFDPIAALTAIGSQAFEGIYKLSFGMEPTDSIIQQMARAQVAELVGKLVKSDGSIVDNPKATYTISAVTRDDIRESLHTSISMSETIDEATARLTKTIDDPARARLIAQTETVNAYQKGLLESGRQSGAVGKVWQNIGADDVCLDNTNLGPIGIDESFSDSAGNDIDGPVAHPRCRCGTRLIYEAEAASKGYKF